MPWGLVVGVDEAGQEIAHKRYQPAAGGGDLLDRPRRAKRLRDVGIHFRLRVRIAKASRGPLDFFARGEDGFGHFELAKFIGVGNQGIGLDLALRCQRQAIA